MLHQSRSNGNKVAVDHLVCSLLVVDQLIQSFKCVSAFISGQLLLQEDFFEFFDGSIKDSDCDLVWDNVGSELILQVGMPGLQLLLDDMVFVTLHF